MDEHRKTQKDRIKGIKTVADYRALMDSLKLSPVERQIADAVFLDALSYAQISEQLNYSERSIKYKMRHILSLLD